jgi:hypothetical protein
MRQVTRRKDIQSPASTPAAHAPRAAKLPQRRRQA